MVLAIGVVIAQSATRFSALALDGPSRRIRRSHSETPLSPEEASATVTGLIREIQEEVGAADSTEKAICCALEADLDAERQRVVSLRYAPGWEDADFRDVLAERLPGVISLATVTEATAVAEYERGASHGQKSQLYILPARGITACYIEQGQVLRGAHGAAGSLDHWPVREDGPRCGCGGRGHLATLASAQSIVRAMIGRASASDESTEAMLRISGGRAEAMTATQVVELAAMGDAAAQSVIEDAAEALASALAALCLALDPGSIVIGGPLALAQPYYFQMLNERLRAHIAGVINLPQVVPGALEPNAALTGAGILASRLLT
ncbi:MAG TPA: ROK family protein [Ktedonobacterales bacterium]